MKSIDESSKGSILFLKGRPQSSGCTQVSQPFSVKIPVGNRHAVLQGLCHVSELSSANWLSRPEDVCKVGDRIDVKLIEVNDKGQLRLSRRVLLPEPESDKAGAKQVTSDSN
ncbi:hypothetical protein Leryth_001168 [Lithospermum erythrorhizon]|nr:hypothetical protein Leryth_001168 [Lithospermum erythrorhizon]